MILKTDIFKKQDAWHQLILAITISVVLVTSCSGSDECEIETLIFAVDSTLLGESFTDSAGLFLLAPAGWKRLSDATVQQVQTGIETSPTGEGRPVPEILALFGIQKYNAHLVVGKYNPELLPADQDSVLSWQKEGLHVRFPNNNVLFHKFLHNQSMFEQLLVVGDKLTVIKLFVRREGQAMYQIEYVVHMSWYETHSKDIESSIGSILFGS